MPVTKPLEFTVSPTTECCRLHSTSYVFTLETESLIIQFGNESGKSGIIYLLFAYQRFFLLKILGNFMSLLLRRSRQKRHRYSVFAPMILQPCNISSFMAIFHNSRTCCKISSVPILTNVLFWVI